MTADEILIILFIVTCLLVLFGSLVMIIEVGLCYHKIVVKDRQDSLEHEIKKGKQNESS